MAGPRWVRAVRAAEAVRRAEIAETSLPMSSAYSRQLTWCSSSPGIGLVQMITDRLGAVRGPRGLPEAAARPRRPAILLISASSAGAFWATGRFPARRTPHAAHDLSHLECIMRRGGFRVHMNQPDGGQAPVQRGGAILSFAGDAKKSATGELSAGSAGQMTFAGRS